MKLDKKYLKKMLRPFKGQVSLNISEYFTELKKLGITVDDDHKLLEHLKELIFKGILVNSKGTKNLKDFGIFLGALDDISLSTSYTISLGNTPKSKWVLISDKYLIPTIIGIIITVIAAVLIHFLKL